MDQNSWIVVGESPREAMEDNEEFPLMGKSKFVHLILLKVLLGRCTLGGQGDQLVLQQSFVDLDLICSSLPAQFYLGSCKSGKIGMACGQDGGIPRSQYSRRPDRSPCTASHIEGTEYFSHITSSRDPDIHTAKDHIGDRTSHPNQFRQLVNRKCYCCEH